MVTLGDLGYEDNVIYGLGEQRINLSFDAPPFEDRSGATIDVIWSHSIAGMTELSSLSVILNGVPIANAALREANVNRAVLRVNIPPTTLQPGPNALQFLFVFQPKDQVCARLVRDAAWGVIHKDTEIRLPQSPTGFCAWLPVLPLSLCAGWQPREQPARAAAHPQAERPDGGDEPGGGPGQAHAQ
ncbi:MAG: hypothetical protein KatS3mg061_2757 [Dehalococcoidia bacterium]|nr:MAG: hypothetical protein KatS3mg061_2757 [Dehalococcoidia bacterium]